MYDDDEDYDYEYDEEGEFKPARNTVSVDADVYRRNTAWNVLRELLQRTDRILSGQDVEVDLFDKNSRDSYNTQNDETPSWTSGNKVTFNKTVLGDPLDRDNLVAINGANYHELSHVKFTMPNETPSQKQFYNSFQGVNNGPNAWNLLEDQRIEQHMVTLYPSTRPYFTTMASNYLLNDPAKIATAYFGMAGRRYMGKKVLDALRQQVSQHPDLTAHDIKTLERIVKTFQSIDPEHQQPLALSLIKQYAKLLDKVNPNQEPMGNHGNDIDQMGGNGGDQSDQSRQDSNSQAMAMPVKSPADYDKDDEQQQGQGDGQGSDGNGPESDSDGSNDGKGGQGKGKDGKDGSGDSRGSNGGSQGQDKGSRGNGSGHKGQNGKNGDQQGYDSAPNDGDPFEGMTPGNYDNQAPEPTKVAIDLLRVLKTQGLADKQLNDEVDDARYQMRHAPIQLPPLQRYEYMGNVATGAGPIANKLRAQFERMRADVDPGWVADNPSGKLNIKRAMHGEDVSRVFDSWNIGNMDASSIEMVVLLDYSSSMGSNARKLGPTAWIIKRACDRLDIPCTVVLYADATYMVYGPKDRALPGKMPSVSAYGGTSPGRALVTAHQILTASKQRHKFLVTMTDGQWDSGYYDKFEKAAGFKKGHDGLIADLNGRGVHTAMFYLGGRSSRVMDAGDEFWHNTKVRVASDDLMDLVTLAKRLVTATMKGGM